MVTVRLRDCTPWPHDLVQVNQAPELRVVQLTGQHWLLQVRAWLGHGAGGAAELASGARARALLRAALARLGAGGPDGPGGDDGVQRALDNHAVVGLGVVRAGLAAERGHDLGAVALLRAGDARFCASHGLALPARPRERTRAARRHTDSRCALGHTDSWDCEPGAIATSAGARLTLGGQ